MVNQVFSSYTLLFLVFRFEWFSTLFALLLTDEPTFILELKESSYVIVSTTAYEMLILIIYLYDRDKITIKFKAWDGCMWISCHFLLCCMLLTFKSLQKVHLIMCKNHVKKCSKMTWIMTQFHSFCGPIWLVWLCDFSHFASRWALNAVDFCWFL